MIGLNPLVFPKVTSLSKILTAHITNKGLMIGVNPLVYPQVNP